MSSKYSLVKTVLENLNETGSNWSTGLSNSEVGQILECLDEKQEDDEKNKSLRGGYIGGYTMSEVLKWWLEVRAGEKKLS